MRYIYKVVLTFEDGSVSHETGLVIANGSPLTRVMSLIESRHYNVVKVTVSVKPE